MRCCGDVAVRAVQAACPDTSASPTSKSVIGENVSIFNAPGRREVPLFRRSDNSFKQAAADTDDGGAFFQCDHVVATHSH